MSTRSTVGILLPDGTIKAIYIHCDGYPQHVGGILKEHYDYAKTMALVELGDCSSLGARVAPDEGESHSYGARAEGVTVAYIRDRGETGCTVSIIESEDAYLRARSDWDAQYQYLFKDNIWYISVRERPFIPLTDKIITTGDCD